MRRIASIIVLLFALPLAGCIETLYNVGDFLGDAAQLQPWKKLALDGDVEAQYKVGTAYCCGDRPKHDNVKALYWWCQAAKQGQRDAQFQVGKMYDSASQYKGNIIQQNPVLAFTYYSLAEKNGNNEAVGFKQKLSGVLSAAQKQEAAALLEEFPNIACEVER